MDINMYEYDLPDEPGHDKNFNTTLIVCPDNTRSMH